MAEETTDQSTQTTQKVPTTVSSSTGHAAGGSSSAAKSDQSDTNKSENQEKANGPMADDRPKKRRRRRKSKNRPVADDQSVTSTAAAASEEPVVSVSVDAPSESASATSLPTPNDAPSKAVADGSAVAGSTPEATSVSTVKPPADQSVKTSSDGPVAGQRSTSTSVPSPTAATSERYTPPPLTARDLNQAAPNLSLQDIQRTRRRRRLIGLGLVIIAAIMVFWRWRQRAATPHELVSEPRPSQTPAVVTTGSEKATLSGSVDASRAFFPAPEIDRIAIYLRPAGESEFYDTGIRLLPSETQWRFLQAAFDQTYDLQAGLVDNDRLVAYSNIVTAVAPAADLRLVFPDQTGALPPDSPLPVVEPITRLAESPYIAGVVKINGSLPSDVQLVIWVGVNGNRASQTDQTGYTFAVDSQEIHYFLSDLAADQEYLLDATLQTSDGRLLATAHQSVVTLVNTDAANFEIDLNYTREQLP